MAEHGRMVKRGLPTLEMSKRQELAESPGRKELYTHAMVALGALARGVSHLEECHAEMTTAEQKWVGMTMEGLLQLLRQLERTKVTDRLRGGPYPGRRH
jgi:hypothetical protein